METTFKKEKKIPAKQYFDLLVFIICILYVVTVTLTKCNQPADRLTFRREIISYDCILLPYPFPPHFLQFLKVFNLF